MNTFAGQPGSARRTQWLGAVFLLAVCAWLFFYQNGLIEIDRMEARNLVTAREMLQEDNWLIPTMNDKIRLAKPPLPTWVAALTAMVGGSIDNLALQRVPSGIFAVLLVLFTGGLARSLSGDDRFAFLCALVMATNMLTKTMANTASWDIYCHSFMLGAIWVLVEAIRGARRWPWFLLAGVLMGLAFLSKGPVPLYSLLLPFSIAYLLIYGTGEIRNCWRPLALAFAVGIAVGGWWPFFVWFFHPEALLATAEQESSAWINLHIKPFWYYFRFPVYTGLWLILAVAVLVKPWAEKQVQSVRDYRFLLLWLALDIVLLSVLPEKKNRYLLPAMIPMAMLVGSLLRAMLENSATSRGHGNPLVLALHTVMISLPALLAPLLIFLRLDSPAGDDLLPRLLPAAVILSIIAAIGWYLFAKRRIFGLILLTAIQACATSAVYTHFNREIMITNPGYEVISDSDASRLPPEAEVFSMQDRDVIMYVWDLNRRVGYWNRGREAAELLEAGKPVAVISSGSPDVRLERHLDMEVTVETIGCYDYNESEPQRKRTCLSLLRPTQAAKPAAATVE